MPQAIKILIAEDNVADAELILRELRRAGFEPDWRRVETEAAFLEGLHPGLDLVLSDYRMPQFTGLRALELLQQRGLKVPFILVSGTIGEDTAVEAMRRGATDYLMKDRLTRLGLAVRRALEQGRMQSEQERILAALRASEERFRQVVENIHEVFWLIDVATRRIIYISPGFETIWGRTCESLYADPEEWINSVHPLDRERVARAAANHEVPGSYDETYRILRPDRTLRWIRDRAFPIRDETGTVRRIVGIAEDITERHRLEEQMRQAQKMEAIGTLAGGIAHDFNNILTAIGGYTALARLDLIENDDVREHLDAVTQGVARATDLVRQILAFSRQQKPERQPIRLHPIVAESLKLLRATLPSSIEFETEIAADAPTVLADATEVHQVLMNLGTNAWHAMKDRNGRLEVRLESFVVGAPDIALHPRLRPGHYARVTVRDTGCGMDQVTLGRIFEPFFTTKPPGEGTGLGLAVVHGIVDNHDGVVTVSSQPGDGTVFRLYFPAHTGEVAVAQAAEGPVPRGHGERVLVVDDEELLVRLGCKALTALGYTVEGVAEPAAALAMIRADPQRFDVVITDQTMPGITGLGLASQIGVIRPGLPVVLMTGQSQALTADRLKAAGICHLLPKPMTIHGLGTAVHAALNLETTS